MTTMLFFSGWLWCIVVVGVASALLLWEKVSTELSLNLKMARIRAPQKSQVSGVYWRFCVVSDK